MEDASGVDLDWFWCGWFYTTEHVDIAVTGLREFELDTKNPEVEEKKRQRKEREEQDSCIAEMRDRDLPRHVDAYKDVKDFYNDYDPPDITKRDRERHEMYMEGLEPHEGTLLDSKKGFFVVDFENVGGIVMSVILDIGFKGGKRQELRISAEIWRCDSKLVPKLILTDEEIVTIQLDPHLETEDPDRLNNDWPMKAGKTHFELFKRQREFDNPMREAGLGKKEPGDEEGKRLDQRSK